MTEPPDPAAGPTSWPPVPPAGATAGAAAPPAPMPFLALLDEAMRWTRRQWRAILPPIAVPVAVVSAGIAALQAVWQSPAGLVGVDPWQVLARGCWFVLMSLPLAVLIGLFYAAMAVAAVDAVDGRGVDVRRALRFVVRPGVLGAQLLVVLAMVAAALCCVFPLLYVGPLLSMTLPAMAAEGVTGPAALRRSAELTRHNPQGGWRSNPIVKILVLYVVVLAISYLVGLVVAGPLLIVQMVWLFRKAASGQDVHQAMAVFLWLQVPVRFLSSLASTAVYLYSCFAGALLFFDLRARREGDDLRRAIAAMAGAGPEPAPPAPLPPLQTPPFEPGSTGPGGLRG
jgi:hypothetical protein